MNVAREPTGRHEVPPNDGLRETWGSAGTSRTPDCAEFIIGRAFARPVGSIRASN
jgi:hypothetical protein